MGKKTNDMAFRDPLEALRNERQQAQEALENVIKEPAISNNNIKRRKPESDRLYVYLPITLLERYSRIIEEKCMDKNKVFQLMLKEWCDKNE